MSARPALCLAGLLCGLACGAATAAAPERFTGFFNRLFVSAEFTQTVYDAHNRPESNASGYMAMRRPDRIRWEYREPDAQVFIVHGGKLLQYDGQLRQAVVREVDEAVSGTPLGWLLGFNPGAFDFQDLARKDGALDWFEIVPLKRAAEFPRMEAGFDGDMLRRLILHDQLERRTEIRFTDAATGRKDPFRIRLPGDVDILGDASAFVAP